MHFEKYAAAGFTAELLPILPAGAEISPSSKNADHLLASRGKVPGRKVSDGWVGFGGWTQHRASEDDARRWDKWGCGVGVQARAFPGVDIDVENREFADFIETEAQLSLGLAPARFGRGARRLLPYRGVGFRKRRLGLRKLGGAAPAAEETGHGPGAEGAGDAGRQADVVRAGHAAPVEAVELLAEGQQYVVEGIHPKTGQPYFWRDGYSPAEAGAQGLVLITPQDVDAFFERVAEAAPRFGYEVVQLASAGAREADVVQDTLLAPSLEALGQALEALPNEADYDDWFSCLVAVKAASAGSAEGRQLFLEWSAKSGKDELETTVYKWDTLKPPYSIGWEYIALRARDHGFNMAAHEFPPLSEAELEAAERAKAQASVDMFEACIWVQRTEQVFHVPTMTLLNRQQFNALFWQVGDPASTKECAWAVFLRSGDRRRSARGITYRPTGALLVHEDYEGGKCVNIWRAPAKPLPAGTVTEADIAPWLEHLAYLIPHERERTTFINWLAWTAQNPHLKPNWGVIIGSPHQGNGKSLSLEPIREALGRHNVRELGPLDLASGYTDWLQGTKLFIVEEMHAAERKATMDTLKGYLATPPYYLRVNPKFGKQFEIPNLVAGVFFTNHENALALEKHDRRFFVIWTEQRPKDEPYYGRLKAWFDDGGAAKAARWLANRELGDFNALGKAPATEAKEEMRKAGRSLVEEWLEEGIADATDPFDGDLVTLEEVFEAVPERVVSRAGRPSHQRLTYMLKRAGARFLGRQRLGGESRGRLFSLRRHEMYAGLDPAKLRDLYAAQIARRLSKGEFA